MVSDRSYSTIYPAMQELNLVWLKLVKEGKLKKSALADSVIYKGDDNKYYEPVSYTHLRMIDYDNIKGIS